ncbi:MAG: MoaD/ThiS family protein [Burkholderiaceae bacterium]|nr:MoaD/ThiS family protein [Microbacteriaceae bacterium]
MLLRFFASARAATGLNETRIDLGPDWSIGDALGTLVAAPGEPLDRVLARCSFLVNTLSTTDTSTVLSDGDVVDVMPPFAGG